MPTSKINVMDNGNIIFASLASEVWLGFERVCNVHMAARIFTHACSHLTSRRGDRSRVDTL